VDALDPGGVLSPIAQLPVQWVLQLAPTDSALLLCRNFGAKGIGLDKVSGGDRCSAGERTADGDEVRLPCIRATKEHEPKNSGVNR